MLTTELKGVGEAIFEKRNIDWLNYGILSEFFSELRVATIFFLRSHRRAHEFKVERLRAETVS